MQKVLVVDDDPDILTVVSLLLKTHGFEVETVQNAAGTIETVYKFLPEIILLDISLSGYDGREICTQLKSLEDLKHIPIVLFSATPNINYKVCDASDFIRKPFDATEMVNVLRKHLKS